MKNYTLPLFALYFAFGGTMTPAQETTTGSALPPLPPGPLVQMRAPDFAQWVVTVTPTLAFGNSNSTSTPPGTDASTATGSQDAGKLPTWTSQITMTKTRTIILREVRNQTGQTWTTWCTPGLQSTLSPDSKSWIMQSRAANADPTVPTANYEDYSQTDFLGFDWINLSKYVGIKVFNGSKCIFFQDSANGGEGRSAYIDLETRLPNTLNAEGKTITYAFKAPPTTELTLPPLLAQLLKNRQKQLDSATPRSQMH